MENQDEKKPAQKSHKIAKGQKMTISKKWIRAEQAEASKAKNLDIQSGLFFTSNTRKAFTKLRQVFIETPILNHFDPKHHIRIKTDVSGYIIGEIFSQLISDDLGWWHPMVFFS